MDQAVPIKQFHQLYFQMISQLGHLPILFLNLFQLNWIMEIKMSMEKDLFLALQEGGIGKTLTPEKVQNLMMILWAVFGPDEVRGITGMGNLQKQEVMSVVTKCNGMD